MLYDGVCVSCHCAAYLIVLPALCLVVAPLCSIQCSGLGGMKPNCVLIAWPDSWRKKDTFSIFMSEEGRGGRGDGGGEGRKRGMRVLVGNMNGQEERVNDEGEGMEGFGCSKGEGGRSGRVWRLEEGLGERV